MDHGRLGNQAGRLLSRITFMNKTTLLTLVAIILITIGLSAWVFADASKPAVSDPQLDQFAKCLSDQGAIMYGAYWCSHCQNQKRLFGQSFELVNYVECTQDVANCEAAGITGYPTWIFADGSRIEGEASFAQLAERTQCPLPE